MLAIVPRPCDLVWLWALVLLLLLCALSSSAHADVRYVYDNAGRVVQVIAADGTSAQYQYDPAGNITAINRFTAGQLVIAAFSPRTAAPGATVTISGSGFVVTPAQNTVRFNGTAATVLSATQHELVVSVPLGATTGPISVTTSAGTVSSAETFIVAEVLEITGFTPPYGAAGTVVTVTGTGFDPAPGHTSVSLAQRYVTTTSIFAQQIQFTVPTNVGSGPISVSTPNAIATTNNNFLVVPPEISSADVIAYGTLTAATAQSVNLSSIDKYAAFTFDGVQNEYLSLQLASFISSNDSVSVHVYGPLNTAIATAMLSSSQRTMHLPRLTQAGTYSVYFGSGGGTHQFSVTLERNQLIPADGVTVNVASSLSQTKRLLFAAVAGQTVGLGVTGISLDPNGYILFNLIQPDGNSLSGWFACDGNVSSPGCSFNFRDLPATGTYRLTAWPNIPSLMSFGLTLSPAVTGTPALNTPQSLNLNAPGKVALYTFTATSGQTVAFNASSIATAPADKAVTLTAYDPAGNQIDTVSSTSNATLNLSNLAAGTYSVLVSVADAATGSMQLIRQ